VPAKWSRRISQSSSDIASSMASIVIAIAMPKRYALACMRISRNSGTSNNPVLPGRRADLVLLDANPLDRLETLRRPRAVIVGGRVLDRTVLDALEVDLRARIE
jgi:hypothetical protein